MYLEAASSQQRMQWHMVEQSPCAFLWLAAWGMQAAVSDASGFTREASGCRHEVCRKVDSAEACSRDD
ncbi:hypothetical protein B5M06_11380 [Comamonas kerstersii]|uniref:Uncharacterized protein n=1 Tax=Comamonas kerstersii TaxID=225992 RepID=A0A0W7Z1D1_9BURK|nr:hypothetical protein B5M06_11380 [Comamonas kerstersii]KUF41112.1 hypothetical protein AS359_09975 [Comamonas kerstersii]